MLVKYKAIQLAALSMLPFLLVSTESLATGIGINGYSDNSNTPSKYHYVGTKLSIFNICLISPNSIFTDQREGFNSIPVDKESRDREEI